MRSDRPRSLDKVILTSRAAGGSAEAVARGAELAAENLYRVLQGRPRSRA